MHFFYMDETGCTGADLDNAQQPIFVLGGISVRDEGWRATNEQISALLKAYFGGTLPHRFELHSHELLNCQGAFNGHDRARVNRLVHDILDIVADRSHAVHFVSIDKAKMRDAIAAGAPQHDVVRTNIPYLLGFNYLISYIERYVRDDLGRSARGMIILDIKDGYQNDIDAITHYRRYDVVAARRLKWLVEFSYPVDSMRHPMIQISDLVIFLIRKFLEIECGYKPAAPDEVRNFFAKCFDKISARVRWANLIEVAGREEQQAHTLLSVAQAKQRAQWRRHYDLT